MIPYVAEFLGTFALLLSILFTNTNPIWVGATVALIIFSISMISGAHVNPVVSLVMWTKGFITNTTLFSYVIAQALGGMAAMYVHKML
jgi:aquaporin Z